MEDTGLYRAIDREVRQEKILSLIKRYGLYGLAVLVILIASGLFMWHQKTSRQEALAVSGDAFLTILEMPPGEKTKRRDLLTAFLQEQTHETLYYTLGRFLEASLQANPEQPLSDTQRQEAARLFQEIASDAQTIPPFQELAQFYALLLSLDETTAAQVSKEVNTLLKPESIWYQPARELKAFALWQSGQGAESLALFTQIAADPAADFMIKTRAEMMETFLTPRYGHAHEDKNL